MIGSNINDSSKGLELGIDIKHKHSLTLKIKLYDI